VTKIREVHKRIQSVKNTQQVTRAMKMISVAKVRRFQKAALDARPYSSHLEEVILAMLRSDDLPKHPLLKTRKSEVQYLVIIAGDRGLCGGFNTNILKKSEEFIKQSKKQVKLVVLGKKILEYFTHRKIPVEKSYVNLEDLDRYKLSMEIADFVIQEYISGNCSQVDIIYSQFISIISQNPVSDQVLPISLEEKDNPEIIPDTIYSPSPEAVINHILPRYILTAFNHAIIESMASVHAARMTTMDTATLNAETLIDDLTLEYNNARQSAITRELIEIVSGAEALKS